MDNSERYHFKDFTRDNYRRLIKMAKAAYVFRHFDNFQRDEKFIIWRHDVDFSMHSARKLAGIEMEEGIKATYCLHLHNPFYNLLEQGVSDCVRDILAMGHEIGLHFEGSYYNIKSVNDMTTRLGQEKQILENIFEKKIGIFSFHMPDEFTRSCRSWRYAGMINAYAKIFTTEVAYCSDSNGYWRVRRLEDVLSEAKDKYLQVLTHPAWWQDTVMSPVERLEHCIQGRAEYSRQWYRRVAAESGRDYINW